VFKPSYLARGIAFFSGTVGFAIKIALLALLNAVAVWAATTLIGRQNYIAVFVLLAATAGIDFVYLVPRKKLIPLKFLIPGTVFLVASRSPGAVHGQRRLHEILDRAPTGESGRSRDPDQLARADGGRRPVPAGLCMGQGRRAGRDPAGRDDRKLGTPKG
jgi:hypothetical protein